VGQKSLDYGPAPEQTALSVEGSASAIPSGDPFGPSLTGPRSRNVSGYVVAFVSLVALALVVAWRLGRLQLPVAASLAAMSLVFALFVIAAWDLVVRWGQLQAVPLLTGPPSSRRMRRLARHVSPPVLLVAGAVCGHFIWT